eukprot:382233_1
MIASLHAVCVAFSLCCIFQLQDRFSLCCIPIAFRIQFVLQCILNYKIDPDCCIPIARSIQFVLHFSLCCAFCIQFVLHAMYFELQDRFSLCCNTKAIQNTYQCLCCAFCVQFVAFQLEDSFLICCNIQLLSRRF